MSQDFWGRIWAALDISDGELAGAMAELVGGLGDPEILTATCEALLSTLCAVADPLIMSPMADLGVRKDDPRFGQALREGFDEIENPTRVREFRQAVTQAFLRALTAAVETELPRWRAARGGPDPSGA